MIGCRREHTIPSESRSDCSAPAWVSRMIYAAGSVALAIYQENMPAVAAKYR